MRHPTATRLQHILGPRPVLTLIIQDMFVREIWVEGRAPCIQIRDYDWGETDTDPSFDTDGCPYSPINWRGPAWRLGLSLHPPAKETYTMANQTLKSIPLSDLKVSRLNMRHSRKKPDISDLLPSIREHGVRQSLLVRPEGKHYGVVAGRRRLFALKQIAKETGVDMNVPCIVMRAGDDAEAIEASILENAARLPAAEMEQYTAFARLHSEGRSIDEIADYFGVTPLKVKRILALAALIEPIRALYAGGEIDAETIRALTVASETRQAEWLALFEDDEMREPRGQFCKAWVTGGQSITTDKALFDLDTYDGEIVTDLFGDHEVFASIDDFWAAQSTAIAAKIEAYRADGWGNITCLERGHLFHRWTYQVCEKDDDASVFIESHADGSIRFHEGYITEQEAKRRDKAKAVRAGNTTAPVRPEMSGPLAEYILLHRHSAAQASLLEHPEIAYRLMVAHAINGSSLWTVQPHQLRTKKSGTRESLEASKAAGEMSAKQTEIEEMFSVLGVSFHMHSTGHSYRLCEIFAALLALSDDEVAKVLAFTMARTLGAGGAVVEAVLHTCETDLLHYWSPDAAFFDLLRDKRAINAMLAESGSPSLAKSMLTDTGKAQKEAILNRINGEGCAPNRDWRPGWMQVPPTRYVENSASAPYDAWQEIARLFEPVSEADQQNEVEPSPDKQAA